MPTIPHCTIQNNGRSLRSKPKAYFMTKHWDMRIFVNNIIAHSLPLLPTSGRSILSHFWLSTDFSVSLISARDEATCCVEQTSFLSYLLFNTMATPLVPVTNTYTFPSRSHS